MLEKYTNKARSLVLSSTAKDTYILFSGNLVSAFSGFVFTILIARAITVAEFGVFSAANNFIFILVAVTDLGIASGIVNFVAEAYAKGDIKRANIYIKASFLIRFWITLVISLLVVVIAPHFSETLFASSDPRVSMWVAIILMLTLFTTFFPFVLQGKKQFLKSVITELSLSVGRVIILIAMIALGSISMYYAFGAFAFAGLFSLITGLIFVGTDWIKVRTTKDIYRKVISFSGWIGVNRVVSSIAGRLDVQMLASMVGATATGFYSIPSRLALFVVVLGSSFSAVLAPRLAAFNDIDKEREYLKKATLAMIPIVVGIVVWIIIAEPFMLLLFGEKYLPAVGVFQALTASMIPFVLAVPAVTAIIYAMKKTVYIGVFSIFQLIITFSLNLWLIPKYNLYGPTITYFIVNGSLMIYAWVIIIRRYRVKK
ncbi:oligosaccharide flippase family protein [Patescibacteria group bacterium]